MFRVSDGEADPTGYDINLFSPQPTKHEMITLHIEIDGLDEV